MQIKQLFDPAKGIDRAIEKVITYGADAEKRLKSEISNMSLLIASKSTFLTCSPRCN